MTKIRSPDWSLVVFQFLLVTNSGAIVVGEPLPEVHITAERGGELVLEAGETRVTTGREQHAWNHAMNNLALYAAAVLIWGYLKAIGGNKVTRMRRIFARLQGVTAGA